MTLLDDTVRPEQDSPADPSRAPRPPRGSWLLALVLACAALMAVDRIGGDDSPVEPARSLISTAFGPAQTAAAAITRPLTAIPEWFSTQSELREQIATLQDSNDELRGRMRTTDYRANRLAAYEGLATQAANIGYELVPARVVAVGPARSFDQTILIDAGSDAGLSADMTVVAAEGLVGRVIKVTGSTATVLLIADAGSTVGGRIGRTMDLGFVRGGGGWSTQSPLSLELVDSGATPARGDAVLTWGSDKGAPYVAGIPIGAVTNVYRDMRDSSQRIEVSPYVDFAALDLIGVVVPLGTRSNRGVIEADGSWR